MIIDEHGWYLGERDLVFGLVISGDEIEWRIPLCALGDAIKAAQEARDGPKDKTPKPSSNAGNFRF